eukprot:scaffold288116_cov18-Prasinocladus_malaysianus.AAC.1
MSILGLGKSIPGDHHGCGRLSGSHCHAKSLTSRSAKQRKSSFSTSQYWHILQPSVAYKTCKTQWKVCLAVAICCQWLLTAMEKNHTQSEQKRSSNVSSATPG